MTRLTKQRFFLLAMLGLTGCTAINPPKDTSTLNKINNDLKQAVTSRAESSAVPEAISSALLPPLKIAVPKSSAKQLEQRFDLVINDTQANQVFMAIVSGTRYSMLVHPDVDGKISVNLKDVTVFETLDALRELYGYEYKIEGSRIYVLKPGLQTKVYKVNYITGIRRGGSDINVTSGGSAAGGSSGSSGSTSASRQSTASNMSMTTRTDFWSEMEDSVRTIIGCGVPGSTTQTAQAAPASTGAGASAVKTGQTESTNFGPRERGKAGCPEGSSVLINPMAGTLLVRARSDELRTVEAMLVTMQANVERQVILEAKIIDVELNSGAQQGINWAGFQAGKHLVSLGANTATIGINQPYVNGGVVTGTLGGVLGTGLVGATGSAFSAGMGVALQLRNFSALLNFLQTQGTVNVLSSPRISTINNQKAVLKVGRDEQYVTGFEGGNSTVPSPGGAVIIQATPIYSTFFSGISLDVTPQIDDEGNITLHVHPLISEVTEVEKKTINDMKLPFASNKISETDSVVKVRDGQIVVIGGLMTDSSSDSRAKVPGFGDIAWLGALFRKGSQSSTKRELVIMLKPTIVHGESTWMDDITATQLRIESLGKSPDAAGSK